jgi:hypothetical protein
MLIDSVGPEQLKWPIGSEPAFTLIPNFLATGIAAIVVGFLAIFWSIFFAHRQNGAVVLLLLFILQTLVGGGVGYTIFYLVVCAHATRINRPLSGWQRLLPSALRGALANEPHFDRAVGGDGFDKPEFCRGRSK